MGSERASAGRVVWGVGGGAWCLVRAGKQRA